MNTGQKMSLGLIVVGGGIGAYYLYKKSGLQASIILGDSDLTAIQGTGVQTLVSVYRLAGSGNVNLAFMSLQEGITGSFDPPSGAPSFGSTLVISVDASVPIGSYGLKVRALADNQVIAEADLTLTVVQGTPQPGSGSISITTYYSTYSDEITGVPFTISPEGYSGVSPGIIENVPEGDHVATGLAYGITATTVFHVTAGQVANVRILFKGGVLGLQSPLSYD